MFLFNGVWIWWYVLVFELKMVNLIIIVLFGLDVIFVCFFFLNFFENEYGCFFLIVVFLLFVFDMFGIFICLCKLLISVNFFLLLVFLFFCLFVNVFIVIWFFLYWRYFLRLLLLIFWIILILICNLNESNVYICMYMV